MDTTVNVDGMHVPPNFDEWTFNIHNITGNVDLDEKGRTVPIEGDNGEKVDKDGRKVNDKGYLVDANGNVIEGKSKKVMFKLDQLDEKGEIPSPFREEKYNFNPHDVTGTF